MEIKPDKKAPAFTLVNHEGKKKSLESYKGKLLCLYFYPKDETPGCTKEACSLRDDYKKLASKGVVVVGISPDSVGLHQKFINNHSLPFELLSDPDHITAENYGVWVKKNMYGKEYYSIARTTFLIDEKGVLRDIIQKVDVANHAKQVLDQLVLNKDN